ncbi:MFS transporter [Chitinophaga nivalis]|uniref:MFS transporter n=1 Tax=Chitinophaga nivalis TaxID=2991709 RepID=A0ABT3II58_9BACT|nr:MFS transporter [Chitinophaga nivalis]MCW3466662.1 MFS transporter [Chitinophaga nivalis]MCW3483647.1 MFS transporter [Chitinophaga nivalis]
MSQTTLPVFRSWVPEWLIRLTILLVLLPPLGMFALYFSNATETAGYYGMEPADVQYSVIIMYAALVAFLPMDDRLVRYLRPRYYFLISVGLNTLTFILCAHSRNIPLFFVCRFVQGVACASFCSICLHLIFSRLASTRARVIGYTVFYGTLQVSIPACAVFCSWLLYYFDFNVLFYVLLLLEIPGSILLLVIMNEVRFKKKFPLYQTDWVSFVFYALLLCMSGYVFVYGQQLNWLHSTLIRQLCLVIVVATVLFIIRQQYLKRPFINLQVFRFADFRNGLLLLMAYYIFKGTTGFVYAHLQGILGVDPVHLMPVYIVNIAGIVAGMLIASRLLLQGTVTRYILTGGFLCLLFFHVQLYFLFAQTGEINHFLLPMLIQGLGTGILFVPIVLFTVAAVPAHLAMNVSFVGISARFMGFCSGIAIANYFQLFNRSMHFNRFRTGITVIDPAVAARAADVQQQVLISGQELQAAKTAAAGSVNRVLAEQVALRASMDYYSMMCVGLIVVLLVLTIRPHAKEVLVKYGKRFIPY